MFKKQYLKIKLVCKVIFSLFVYVVNGVKEVKFFGDFNNWSLEFVLKMKVVKDEY